MPTREDRVPIIERFFKMVDKKTMMSVGIGLVLKVRVMEK
jgi:hypothetical protein